MRAPDTRHLDGRRPDLHAPHFHEGGCGPARALWSGGAQIVRTPGFWETFWATMWVRWSARLRRGYSPSTSLGVIGKESRPTRPSGVRHRTPRCIAPSWTRWLQRVVEALHALFAW